MKQKTKISILYPYFHPGYKAGGITQSLFNLIQILKETKEIQVICYDHDKDIIDPYDFIKFKRTKNLPDNINIYYLAEKFFTRSSFLLLKKYSPDFVYINSIFDFPFLLVGIIYSKKCNKKLVIAPRGMLHAGGIEKGTLKKKIYLFILKAILNKGQMFWHATDLQEKEDIKEWFGNDSHIYIAKDTPRTLPLVEQLPEKNDTVLHLVYYSLITSKKNLLLLLEALQMVKSNVLLDIFGPIIENNYWQICENIINELNKKDNIKIAYKGSTNFENFAKMSKNYHYMVLPTKGENFGHVIFEAFSVGLPVIISDYTPWKFENGSLGYIVELDAPAFAEQIDKIADLDNIAFKSQSNNVLNYAKDFFANNLELAKKQYENIFELQTK